MKLKANLLLATLLSVALPLLGGPLNQAQVPGDAKWVLHLDLDSLKTSPLNSLLLDQTNPTNGLGKTRRELKEKYDFDLDASKLSSLTLFGSQSGRATNQGVVLIKSSLDFPKALDQALLKTRTNSAGQPSIRRLAQTPYPIYQQEDATLLAPVGRELLLISNSREDLDQARAVLVGQAENLDKSKSFADYAKPAPGAFVELLASGGAGVSLPSQAQFLKNTDGTHLAIGQKGNQIYLALELKGRDAEAAAKLQQSLQGLLALVALGSQDNKALLQIAQTARFSVTNQMLNVGLTLPIDWVKQQAGQFSPGTLGTGK